MEELPGCDVQERSLEEARESLNEVIQLIVTPIGNFVARELSEETVGAGP